MRLRSSFCFASVAAASFLVLSAAPALWSQGASLPGCAAVPQVQSVMTVKLDDDLLAKMKFTERVAYERKILDDLMARYPRELTPYESYASMLEESAPEEYTALRARWVQGAKDHPSDPLALLLGARALTDIDTPQAIALLEAARAKAPDFPWPALRLAGIYSSGKRADLDKTKANLEAFFTLCPGSNDGNAQWMLNKDAAFQPRAAAAMRARLATETDPKKLEDFTTLWGLEFRNHPPTEHDAVRAQVTLDLKRLEVVNPHGDAAWESFMAGGYKQSGAADATVTAMEDRLLRDYPQSDEAYEVVSDRWQKAHEKPTDQTDLAAWTAYNQEHKKALKAWIAAYPNTDYVQHYAWFFNIVNDRDVSEKDGLPAVDAFVDYIRDYQAPSYRGNYYTYAANFLINNKLQPARALDLVLQARAAVAKSRADTPVNDNLTVEDAKNEADYHTRQDQDNDDYTLEAAEQAGKPEEGLKLKAEVEGPVPTEKKLLSGYWHDRALLEELEKHNQDALAYYQLALTTRISEPKAYQGKVTDDLKDAAHALWQKQGGTEVAWALWTSPKGATPESAEGRWEKATKAIPDFELSDMSGKTWKLKELAGKTVLINLWATWCGPCQGELPELQTFYEKNKDNKDIVVLTFDIDQDLGVLAPYLKKKGFTFPVLPAYSTVVALLDGYAIPQTWLVDPHGVWQWTQTGFSGGSQADFDKDMMTRLNAVKGGQ